jgi:hypothetical protein
VDLSKLTTSDKVIAGSGIVLFIASFLPWFGLDGFSGSGNAWDVGFFWGAMPAILGAVTAAVVMLKANGTELPKLPIPWGQAFLIVGALCGALVILKLIVGHEECGFGACVDFDRKWGLFLSAIAGAGFAYGGFLKFQEDKGSSAV